MKNKILVFLIALGFLIPVISLASSCTPFATVQGGTFNCGLAPGFIFFGGTTATSPMATSSGFFWTNSLSRLTATNASSTNSSIATALLLNALATPAGSVLAVDATGRVIATSTSLGTVTSVGSGSGLAGGPITTTGTLYAPTIVGTSSAETATRIPFYTTTGAFPALLSGGNAGFTFNTTDTRLTVTNASTTIFSAGTICFTGDTCKTAWPTGTVTSIVAGTGLNGGTITTSGTVSQKNYLSTSTAETATRLAFWDSTAGTPAQLNGGSSGLTFDGSKLTFNYSSSTLFSSFITASSTNGSFGSSLIIPNSASTSLTTTGQIAMNTSAASTSLQYMNGTDHALYDVTNVGFSYINYPSSGTGTTTLFFKGGPRGRQIVNGGCTGYLGTSNAQLGSGTASTTMIVAAAPPGTNNITFSTNNVFQSWQDIQVAVGTFSSAGTSTISCAYGLRNIY